MEVRQWQCMHPVRVQLPPAACVCVCGSVYSICWYLHSRLSWPADVVESSTWTVGTYDSSAPCMPSQCVVHDFPSQITADHLAQIFKSRCCQVQQQRPANVSAVASNCFGRWFGMQHDAEEKGLVSYAGRAASGQRHQTFLLCYQQEPTCSP